MYHTRQTIWIMEETNVKKVLRRPREKYSVMAMEPKYAAVNGRRGVEARCVRYVTGPVIAAHEARKRTEPSVHNIANLRGLNERTGKRKKQITKHAAAATLHPANMRRRSHLLKAKKASSSSLLLAAGSGAPALSIVGNLT